MRLQRVLVNGWLGVIILQERHSRIVYTVRITDDRCFSAARLV